MLYPTLQSSKSDPIISVYEQRMSLMTASGNASTRLKRVNRVNRVVRVNCVNCVNGMNGVNYSIRVNCVNRVNCQKR